MHAFSYCATRGVRGPRPGRLVASLFVVLLVLVGGSSGGGNAAASVSTGDPVAPYDGADGADGAGGAGGAVRCSTPGDCLPEPVVLTPGAGSRTEGGPASPSTGRPALPATGGGPLISVAAFGAVLIIVGAVAAAVGRDRWNRRRRRAREGRAGH